MKKNRIIAFCSASIMTICLAMSSGVQAATNDTTVDKTTMRDMTTVQIVKDMGLGFNLGNTFDAFGDWINGKTVKDYETAWGAPVTTRAIIDGIHNAGFNSLRVPAAWSNLIADDNTINPELFNRVEEVVNYALDDNMYVIINIHYDGGWTKKFSTDYEDAMKKYKSLWTQIGTRFGKYGDHVIFESQNEEGVYDDIWNHYNPNNTTGKDKAFGILNNANQVFVDLIRSLGGNNEKRHLLIAGYATDVDLTCDPLYKMPKDPQNRCAVSVHYYSPYNFVLMEKDESWGKVRTTWGTDDDIKQFNEAMNKLKTTFVDKGIPVIIGEYGMYQRNKTPEMVSLWMKTVCKAAYDLGICPMIWDVQTHDNSNFYNRNTCQFNNPEILKELRAIAGITGTVAVAKTGWVKDGSNWKYINQDGSKATGWLKDDNKWYYIASNGSMLKGWIQKEGSWYYFDDSGIMLSNTTVDSYTLGNDGRMLS